ncbi:MAG: hypothetical protein H8E34_09320 [Bacteroidetes bacterium]|nr:hypothetical protein [Bacteroidota bacterium]MBL6942865.1 hypothetical protein [Bacteroidales bacterium]
MKIFTIVIVIIIGILFNPLFSQEFVDLKNGEDAHISGFLVSYSVVKKETKKDSDLYRLTATVTNQSAHYMRIFDVAPESFLEVPQNALAYFQFTNATGKALSATAAYFYPRPKYLKVSYKCKKCPPIAKDEDPYEHFTESVIIGVEFNSGATISNAYHIRVPEGEEPTVRVMIY